jgi:hypothetical protein
MNTNLLTPCAVESTSEQLDSLMIQFEFTFPSGINEGKQENSRLVLRSFISKSSLREKLYL